MKVVKDNNISLEEIIRNYDGYIIVLKKYGKDLRPLENRIYVLNREGNLYVFRDILSNNIWVSYRELEVLFNNINLDDLYAFEDYTSFAKWLNNINISITPS